MVRKFWNQNAYFDPGVDDGWYYASAVVDPYRNLYILSSFLESGGAGRQLVLDLDSMGWTVWDIDGWAWIVGREWQTGESVARGESIVCFGGASAAFYKLTDGKADDGTSFNWSYRTRRFTGGDPLAWKMWKDFAFLFERRSFGGSDAAVTITPYLDGIAATGSGSITLTSSADALLDREQAAISIGPGKTLQLHIAGTQTDDLTHAELAALSGEFVPVGDRRQG
jgi:hypothetical protein